LYFPLWFMPALGAVKVQSEPVNTAVAETLEPPMPTRNWLVAHVPTKALLPPSPSPPQESMAREDTRRSAAITNKNAFFIKASF
jgi:hypothetical protein